MTNAVTNILENINKQLDHFVFDGYHAVVSVFSNTLILLLVIYFAGLGWMVIRGLIPLTPMALAWHMLKAAVVVAFALHWDYFSYFIVNFFLHGMDKLSAAILVSASSSDTENILTISDGFAKIWQSGTNLFSDLWRASGATFLLGTLMGFIGFIVVIGITGIALFYLLMSKVALSVLLILAPVILPMFLWNATREIFNGWLRLLVQWMLTPLFIYCLAVIFVNIIQGQIDGMAQAVQGPTTASISAFVLIGLITMGIFKQAASMSRDIAKKVAIHDKWSHVAGHNMVPSMAFNAFRQEKGTL